MLITTPASMLNARGDKLAYMGDTTQTIGERIREARQTYRISQGSLAKRVGVSASAVSQWESGDVRGLKPANLLATARALGISVQWLVYGSGRMRADTGGPATRVPVVPWHNAGDADHTIREERCEEYVDAAFPADARLFATVIPDDSMGGEIPRGSTLVVDLELAPEPGDYILVRHIETGDVSCRRLIRDAGRLYLQAANPAYPMHSADGHEIIGVVREVIRRFR